MQCIVCGCNAGLRADERELVDFLVLSQCRSFVGLGMSTFSLFVSQFKAKGGHSAVLVRGVVGSIPDFFRFQIVPLTPLQVEAAKCQAIYDSDDGAGRRKSTQADNPYPGSEDSVAICLVVKEQADDILEVR